MRTVASRTTSATRAAGGQRAQEVVGELLREGAAHEQGRGPPALDLAGHALALADDGLEVEGRDGAALVDGDGARAGQGRVPIRARVAGSSAGRVSISRVAPWCRDGLVEGVGHQAAGGHDDGVAHARRGAAQAVDGAVDQHEAGAVGVQAGRGGGDLGQRRGAADLDAAVAGGAPYDDAAQRGVEGQASSCSMA